MLDAVLRLLDRVLSLVEKATTPDPLLHQWMTVALKRNGKLVRDTRCRRCGTFRRNPVQDDEVCKAAK